MKVLRAELGGDLAQTKRTLQQIRVGMFVGTMPEVALLALRLRAAGVEAEAECPRQPDEDSAGRPPSAADPPQPRHR